MPTPKSDRRMEEFDPGHVHDKRHLGQFFTPADLAKMLAGWMVPPASGARVLDPGAGAGSLTRAVLKRFQGKPVSAVALERDVSLVREWDWPPHVSAVEADFTEPNTWFELGHFTHVVMNPPYVRIRAGSPMRERLALAGIAVPNLYAAFLWIGLDLLEPGGELVAIVPRSFFNGAHFKQLRAHIRASASIDRIHVFGSRDGIFGDPVLQETVVVKLTKRSQRRTVRVSRSSLVSREDELSHRFPSRRILGSPSDSIFRIPSVAHPALLSDMSTWRGLLSEDMTVSTGSVVDFRASGQVLAAPTDATVPLVDSKAAGFGNRREPRFARYYLPKESDSHVFPRGNYVVVRRISPKEQSDRLKVVIVRASDLPDIGVAFENHVNVVHKSRRGLTLEECERVARELRSDLAAAQFDEIGGSTQVNAGDLRALKYPRE